MLVEKRRSKSTEGRGSRLTVRLSVIIFSILALFLIQVYTNYSFLCRKERVTLKRDNTITFGNTNEGIKSKAHRHQGAYSQNNTEVIPVIHSRQVNWIPSGTLRYPDHFSASWIQPVAKFLSVNTNSINIVEGAVHRVYYLNQKNIRMTTDWFDFSVEHMSKWWKTQHDNYYGKAAVDHITKEFLRYINSTKSLENNTLLHPTIAIIAFSPYFQGGKQVSKKGWETLTISSLGATVQSLKRAGFGRIVVVGIDANDEEFVRKAFDVLDDSSTIELGYVRVVRESWYKSGKIKVNRPKAAMKGLQQALKGALSSEETRLWLGSRHAKDYWKYVYLTEPDSILHMRASSMKTFQQELENGFVLLPHRLQPVPHEADIPSASTKNTCIRYFGDFENKTILDMNEESACCDQGAQRPFNHLPHCGNFWYLCGFSKKKAITNVTLYNELFERYRDFGFIRLSHGTNIVSIAGSEHGRQCRPVSTPNYTCPVFKS